jgi:hypothetical protein
LTTWPILNLALRVLFMGWKLDRNRGARQPS